MALKRTQTVEEVAEILGVHPDTIYAHVRSKEKKLPHSRKGRRILLNAEEIASWGKANRVTWKPGRPTETPDSPDLEAARLRKENALASKYELQVSREKKELVLLSDVKATFAEEVSRAKGRFMGLGAEVASACEGLDAAGIQGVIDGKVELILRELSDGLS